jgi:tetratricopeptide (TPR) repeat protein
VLALGIEWLVARNFIASRAPLVAASMTSLLVIALGAACVRQNMYWNDSITLYRRCVAVNPQSSASHTVMSRIYFDAGRPREAEAEALEALRLDPNNLAAYMNLSFYSRIAGKLDKAIEFIEQAVSTVSENPMTRYDLATAYLNLGLLYGQQKDPLQAEAGLFKSITLYPRPVGWYYMGQFYFEQNRPEEALVMFERTAADVPHWFSPIHIKLGMVYEKLGRLEEAKAAYSRFLEVAPVASPDIKDVRAHLLQLNSKRPTP